METLFLVLGVGIISAMLAYRTGSKYNIPDVQPKAQSSSQNSDSAREAFILAQITDSVITVDESKRVRALLNQNAIDLLTHEVEGRRLSEVIYPKQPVRQSEVDQTLDYLFRAEVPSEQHELITLLPVEINIIDRIMRLRYAFSSQENLLYIILSEGSVTETFASDVNDKMTELEMAIEVLTHQKAYFELKEMLHQFTTVEIERLCYEIHDGQRLKNAIRYALHPIKLRCLSLSLSNTLKAIEYLEENIDHMAVDLSVEQLLYRLDNLGIYRLMEVDQMLLNQRFGDDLLTSRSLPVSMEAFHEISHLIDNLQESDEKLQLATRYARIRHVGVEEIIQRFDKFARDYAKKLGKKVRPIIYEGETLLIDEERYGEVINDFIELISNAIEHGIEFPSDRYRNGKPEHGMIKVTTRLNDLGLLISFEDDGRGIDINAVKDVLYDKKLMPFDEIVVMDDQQVMEAVFMEGVTTYASHDRLSRGTGLSILKKRIEASGGVVSVSSGVNLFTRFDILIKID